MVGAELSSVQVRTVTVDEDGVLDVHALHEALDGPVAVVSVMAANNETGVLQPLDAVASAARAIGAVSHTDVVAAAPWMDLRLVGAEMDMISLCAHKIGGPVNAGALVLRRDVALDPLTPGGGQEKGRRGGTVDVAAAVGLATALRLVDDERVTAVAHTLALREQLAAGLRQIDGCLITAQGAERLPGTVHVTFPDVASDELLFLLDQAGLYASAAASCSSGAAVASHVLAAMGIAPERAKGSLRLSFGAETSFGDVERALAIVTNCVARLRDESRAR
jgi:cysteine desulfurase